jgi:hypothetical protein
MNLIIIIIIIIFILIININNNNEHFDQRIDGATNKQCGIACTKILGCSGFSYDDKNKYCFISKNPIVLRPLKKAFVQYYDKKFPRCNKEYTIDDPYYNSRNNLIRNATYSCQKYENDLDIKYKIYDNKERVWNANISTINKAVINPYKFERIDWNAIPSVSDGRFDTSLEFKAPKSKDDTYVIPAGLKLNNDSSVAYDSGPIIKMPDLINDKKYRGTRPIIQPEDDINPPQNIKSSGPIDLNRNLHLITNPTKSNSIIIMRQYDDEFMGQYQFHHKCSTNISKDKCLKQCSESSDCVGTEWNPVLFKKVGKPNLYEIEENVCCPKKKINKVVTRRKDLRKGNFYLKELANKNYIQSNELLVGLNNNPTENQTDNNSENYYEWKNNIH